MTSPIVINSSQIDTWFSKCKTNPETKLTLYCFPYAGGNDMTYRDWSDKLPTTVEVCPVYLPGRGRRMREASFNKVQHLVQSAAEAMRPHLNQPFAFFGHSMGAIISFELTRLLEREYGLQPIQIFVSSRRAPHLQHNEPKTYHLPEQEFLDELRRLNGTPKEVLEHPELLQLLLPMLRSDFEVCQTYEYLPGPPLDCPITAFGGVLDCDVLREHLEAWREHTSADFKLYMFPGDHFYINAYQHLLFQTLNQELLSIAKTLSCA